MRLILVCVLALSGMVFGGNEGKIPTFTGDLSARKFVMLFTNLEGVSTSFLLCGIPLQLKGTHDAIHEMSWKASLEGRKNVAYVNYDVSRNVTCLVLFTIIRTWVRADVVQFLDEEKPRERPAHPVESPAADQ